MYALVMQYDNMMVWGSVIETDIEYFDMILYDNIMLIQFNLSFTIFPGWGGYADHQARDIWIGEAHGWTLAGISGAMGLSKLCIKRRLVQGMKVNESREICWFCLIYFWVWVWLHTDSYIQKGCHADHFVVFSRCCICCSNSLLVLSYLAYVL